MKKWIGIFFLFGLASIAQKNDSLISLINKETNTLKKHELELQLATEYLKSSNYNQCIEISKNLILLKPKNIKEDALILLAKSYIALAEIDSAQKYVSKSIQLSQKNNSTENLAKSYFVQSQIFQYEADFTQQANYSLKSIELAKKTNNIELLEYNYRNMAMLYLDQQNYKKALDFSKKSLYYAKLINNPKKTSVAYGAVGETYSMMYVDDKADYYFRKSYDEAIKVDFKMGIAWTLTNWANIKTGNEALKMREEAQKIWNDLSPDNIMSITNLSQIGLLYHQKAETKNIPEKEKQKNLELAESYLIQAIQKSKKSDNTTTYMESAKVLAKIYFTKKDYKNAYLLQNEYQALNDSLFSQENKNKIAELESKQKLTQKDKEIALKKLTILENKRQKSFLIIGLISLSVIGLLLFYQNQNRKKTNKLLRNLNAELDNANKTKTRFFSILNHDLRSPVSNLIDFLHIQKNSPDLLDEETKIRIEKTTLSSAENLLSSMEDILQWSKSQMENFQPQPKTISIKSIFNDTQKHFESEKNIRITFENPNNIKIITDENYLKTIVRNLTGNAVKALENIENPKIIWKAWQEKNITFLSITDNGSGAALEQFKALYDDKEVVGIKTGLGLHLIRDLAKAIKCEIKVESEKDKGTTFTLTFDK
jgi:signal transduction histidine kinase